MKTLSPLLSDVEIDRSQTFKNLSLYPLLSTSGSRNVDYTLFSVDRDRNLSLIHISEPTRPY